MYFHSLEKIKYVDLIFLYNLFKEREYIFNTTYRFQIIWIDGDTAYLESESIFLIPHIGFNSFVS